MKRIYTTLLTMFVVALLASSQALAQDSGDYRSAADGDWSDSATWETFDGTDWSAAGSAPDGSENITILAEDSVDVDISVSIDGYVTVEGDDTDSGGLLEVTDGDLTVADGGTYEHARDGGSVPEADWDDGSTIVFTGITGNGPDNRGQEYYNITWNNPDQAGNISLGWGEVTIGGTIHVVDSGSARFHMTDAGSGDGETITVEGDVIVEGGQLTTTGSGDAAVYTVDVFGDVEVHDGGNLAPSRGSGGEATWNLHGDFTVDEGATLQDSHDDDMGRFVFADTESQTIAVSEDASYTGTINYTVTSDASVEIAADTDFLFEAEFLVEEDGHVDINGNFIKDGDGVVELDGDMDVNDGGFYVYARQEGPGVPDANWNEGSTIMFTGLEGGAPSGANRDFYHVIFDNENQASNFDVGWGADQNEIHGDVHIRNTGGNQLRLTWAGRAEEDITVNIAGDVIVEGENTEVTTTGSGDEQTYFVNVGNDLIVRDGGYLAASRGSSGMAVWNLNGNLVVDGGELGDSDDHDQEESFAFVADTTGDGDPGQTATVNNISFNGPVHFKVADSSGVTVLEGSEFTVEDSFVNHGIIEVEDDGELVFSGDDAVYHHAQDGGSVPTSTWEEGSTALFTDIAGSGPGNASQDFHNIILDIPDNASNNHFDMGGNTISGDIDIVTTGDSRFYFAEPEFEEDLEITVMGDITMQDGSFSTNGTGNGNSSVTIHHYGDITVEDGNFSISRGSGPFVEWFLYEGSFEFTAGVTQNSAPRSGSGFIFTGEDTTQHLSVTEDVELDNLPIFVDSLATLDIGESDFGGMSEIIEVRPGGALATSNELGFDENLDSEILNLSTEGHYILNGTEEQETGFSLPLNIASLTIDNEAGVTQSREITFHEFLRLSAGVFDNTAGFTLAEGAELIEDGGSLLIPVDSGGEPLPLPQPPYSVGDTANYNGSFDIDTEVGDAEADAWLVEGTEGSSWEIVDDAADEDDRALSFSVVHSGEEWHFNQAVNEPINVVEGDRYSASISLKADEEGRIVRFYVGMPADGNWERVRGWETPQLELTTEWEEYEFEFEATEDHETNGLRIATEFNVEANDGGTIFIDNAVLEKIEDVSNDPVVDDIPQQFELNQNYPNPFNPSTTISYDLPEAVDVTLTVFDVTGRQVAELVNEHQSAGSHQIEWNASNFATGMYIYRIQAGDFTAVRKLTLVK